MNLEKMMAYDPIGTLERLRESIPMDNTVVGISPDYWIVVCEWVGNKTTLVNMFNLLVSPFDDEEQLYEEHRKYPDSDLTFAYIGTFKNYGIAYGVRGTSDKVFPSCSEEFEPTYEDVPFLDDEAGV